MDLSLLGVSDNEEKTYRTLIRLGKSSASEISRESEVSYGKIYEVLARLEAKGLVQIIPEQTKKFIASNPKNLLKLIEQKEQEFENLKKETNKLQKEYEFHEEEAVQITRGKKNFYKAFIGAKKPETFSYSIKLTAEYKPQFIKENKELRKKGIQPLVLTQVTPESKENLKKWQKIHTNFKSIENQGVAMDIHDNWVLIVLANQNIILTIKDKAFINIMKQLFESTYKKAKPLKL